MHPNTTPSIEELLSSLTLEEKIALVSGHRSMYTNAVDRLSIPALRVSDGPHGLRVQSENGDVSVSNSLPSTAFPTASCSANSWNPELLKKMGNAIADEARYFGIDIVLGPGVNIKRNPLCGRNFEYFSEDPFLAGRLGAGEVLGIQEKGIGVSVKHFALNNADNFRFMGNSIADMRAIRELYLRQFEHIVKTATPETVMCSYNQINGTFASENPWLLTDILRNEWGFQGLVMTDWGAVNDRVKGLQAGLDLEMPGDNAICRKWIDDAVKNGSLDINVLDQAVRNVLTLVHNHPKKARLESIDWEAHHQLAKEIATEGAVLLKNNGVLPLKQEEPLLILGELFEKMRYQGGGSSMINPTQVTSPKEAFDHHHVTYRYVKGYQTSEEKPNAALMDEALWAAQNYDKVILFLGLTDMSESEGIDRDNMALSANQRALVDALVKKNKKLIVVLYGGSVFELPFYDHVDGMLNMFLAGQNAGEATFELLFGLKNPGGRLAETWPMTYNDVPFAAEYSKTIQEVYKESIYVGYRYYQTAQKEVRFPFGYGLSYTTFGYNDYKVEQTDDTLVITLQVTNTGTNEGSDTVQVYVSAPKSEIHKPRRELKGFAKIHLVPNESKTLTMTIAKDDLNYWNLKENRFVLESGEYRVQIGRNARDIVFDQTLIIAGETLESGDTQEVRKIYQTLDFARVTDSVFETMSGLKIPPLRKRKPITLESTIEDLNHTFFGKIFYNAIRRVADKEIKKALMFPEGPERDNKVKSALFLKRVMMSNSIRSMSMSSGGALPYPFACGFRDVANGHLFKGIKDFLSKTEAPKLPNDKESK